MIHQHTPQQHHPPTEWLRRRCHDLACFGTVAAAASHLLAAVSARKRYVAEFVSTLGAAALTAGAARRRRLIRCVLRELFTMASYKDWAG